MTNHYIDLKNSDCILMMGANPAENHPVSFKWIMKAKEKGAKLLSVDPRYTRTSARSDMYVPMRSGTDIAILGGMIKYILDNDLFFKDYVVNYTNASFLVNPDFGFKDGLFSGWDEASTSYKKETWTFQMDAQGIPKKDPSLKDPNCVFQLMKKHYERYTIDRVNDVSGAPKDKLLEFYKTYSATGAPDKAGTSMYAMGWTQHTIGVQIIRTMAMIQLLLGNIGVAGGGVNALRGESNVQGSTDQALLFHIIPAYMPTPRANLATLDAYNATTPKSPDPKSANWWQNRPKYIASLLKAMYPGQDPATSYNYLPKLDAGQNCSWLVMFDHMLQGKFKGYFAWGQNPAGCGANSGKTREALSKLDWMVVVNVFDNETASFWKGPKVNPAQVKTEVFVLPPAVFCEKEGSISNSGRWIQWRYQGPKPLGDCIPDGDIALELWKKVRDLYKKEGGVFPDPILNFNEKDVADNSKSFPHQFDAHKVAKLMNGYFVTDKKIGDTTYKAGTQVPSFPLLQDDGSTASGNWLHCGSYTEAGNLMARRGKEQTEMQANIGLFPNWSFCWPLNRRIIYNRASCDPQGQPYAPNKAVIKWDGSKWVGDVPDGGWAPSERHPFIMTAEGYARLFGPGLADGPFPEHYEALECPFEEQPFSKQLHNPAALVFAGEEEKRANCDPRYPFVGTSYRVTEHWQSGVMTRWTPWLLEAMPQNFAEIDPELGRLRGIKSGDKVIVENMRGAIECVAIVTPRLQPMTSQGQTLHMVGVLWHFGWVHPKDGGDSANLLTPSVGDPNTNIPETKTFMVNIRKI
jgi:formate dehydrogenase major subunit